MRVETLATGVGPALDAHARALLGDEGPARGLLVPWTALTPRASPTGVTPRGLATALAMAQEAYGTGRLAHANALALAEGACAVVAGQQAGLLGGPLLVLHKAAAAIAVARDLAERLRRPVVPVFWVASEDHDLDEANRTWVLDAAGALRGLRLDLAADGRSVRDVALPPAAVEALLESLREALPPTPRGAEALLAATPPPSPDLGTWFAAVLARIFGDAGLVVVEPHVLAPWAGPTFSRLARGAGAVGTAIAASGESLRRAGLEAPLAPPPGGAAFFVRETARGPRRRPADLPGAPSGDALARLVEMRPELASGDVLGRLFLQHALLPVVAAVGGPSELAYAAQARAAHEALGVAFPAMAPRPTATWVEARAEEALAALGMRLEEVLAGTASAPEPDPAPAPPDDGASRLAALRAEVERLGAEAGTSSKAAAALRAAARALEEAAGARVREAEERAGRGRGRFERAMTLLRPRGKPQERVLASVSLVARHGLEGVRAGLARLDPLARGHQLVRPD